MEGCPLSPKFQSILKNAGSDFKKFLDSIELVHSPTSTLQRAKQLGLEHATIYEQHKADKVATANKVTSKVSELHTANDQSEVAAEESFASSRSGGMSSESTTASDRTGSACTPTATRLNKSKASALAAALGHNGCKPRELSRDINNRVEPQRLLNQTEHGRSIDITSRSPGGDSLMLETSGLSPALKTSPFDASRDEKSADSDPPSAPDSAAAVGAPPVPPPTAGPDPDAAATPLLRNFCGPNVPPTPPPPPPPAARVHEVHEHGVGTATGSDLRVSISLLSVSVLDATARRDMDPCPTDCKPPDKQLEVEAEVAHQLRGSSLEMPLSEEKPSHAAAAARVAKQIDTEVKELDNSMSLEHTERLQERPWEAMGQVTPLSLTRNSGPIVREMVATMEGTRGYPSTSSHALPPFTPPTTEGEEEEDGKEEEFGGGERGDSTSLNAAAISSGDGRNVPLNLHFESPVSSLSSSSGDSATIDKWFDGVSLFRDGRSIGSIDSSGAHGSSTLNPALSTQPSPAAIAAAAAAAESEEQPSTPAAASAVVAAGEACGSTTVPHPAPQPSLAAIAAAAAAAESEEKPSTPAAAAAAVAAGEVCGSTTVPHPAPQPSLAAIAAAAAAAESEEQPSTPAAASAVVAAGEACGSTTVPHPAPQPSLAAIAAAAAAAESEEKPSTPAAAAAAVAAGEVCGSTTVPHPAPQPSLAAIAAAAAAAESEEQPSTPAAAAAAVAAGEACGSKTAPHSAPQPPPAAIAAAAEPGEQPSTPSPASPASSITINSAASISTPRIFEEIIVTPTTTLFLPQMSVALKPPTAAAAAPSSSQPQSLSGEGWGGLNMVLSEERTYPSLPQRRPLLLLLLLLLAGVTWKGRNMPYPPGLDVNDAGALLKELDVRGELDISKEKGAMVTVEETGSDGGDDKDGEDGGGGSNKSASEGSELKDKDSDGCVGFELTNSSAAAAPLSPPPSPTAASSSSIEVASSTASTTALMVVSGLPLAVLGETSTAKCLCYLPHTQGLAFVGSSFGDFQLLRLLKPPPPPPSLAFVAFSSSSFSFSGGGLQVVDSFTDLSPIADLLVVVIDGASTSGSGAGAGSASIAFGAAVGAQDGGGGGGKQSQVITCSGAGKDGSLKVVRSGVGVEELASVSMVGVKGLWALKEHSDIDLDLRNSGSRQGDTHSKDDADSGDGSAVDDCGDHYEEKLEEYDGKFLPGQTIFVANFVATATTAAAASLPWLSTVQVTAQEVQLLETATLEPVGAPWHPTATLDPSIDDEDATGGGGGAIIVVAVALRSTECVFVCFFILLAYLGLIAKSKCVFKATAKNDEDTASFLKDAEKSDALTKSPCVPNVDNAEGASSPSLGASASQVHHSGGSGNADDAEGAGSGSLDASTRASPEHHSGGSGNVDNAEGASSPSLGASASPVHHSGGSGNDAESPTVMPEEGGAPQQTIGGSSSEAVNVEVDMSLFRAFILNFEDRGGEGDDEDGGGGAGGGKYVRALEEIISTRDFNLSINCRDLYNFSPCRKLYYLLLQYPLKIMPTMDLIAHQLYQEFASANSGGRAGLGAGAGSVVEVEAGLGERRVQVRPFNSHILLQLRDLGPKTIDRLVVIEGMVTCVSPLAPDLQKECALCGETMKGATDRGRFDELYDCPGCSGRSRSDKQMVWLQEDSEETPPGGVPVAVVLLLPKESVNAMWPGARVECCAVAKTNGCIKVTGVQREIPGTTDTNVYVISYRHVERNNSNATNQMARLTHCPGAAIGAATAGGGGLAPERNTAASSFAKTVPVLNYGVLGQAVTAAGAFVSRAPDPAAVPGTVIVDPAGLHHIQPPGGPSGAGGAAGAIYKYTGIASHEQFPPDVVAAITKTSHAKYHQYTKPSTDFAAKGVEEVTEEAVHVIHVVGPDLRTDFGGGALSDGGAGFTRTQAVAALAEAYKNVLTEFVASGQPSLRLLPLSGGIFAGKSLGEIPAVTLEALEKGFQLVDPARQAALRAKLPGSIVMCVFEDTALSTFYDAGFPGAEAVAGANRDGGGSGGGGGGYTDEDESPPTPPAAGDIFELGNTSLQSIHGDEGGECVKCIDSSPQTPSLPPAAITAVATASTGNGDGLGGGGEDSGGGGDIDGEVGDDNEYDQDGQVCVYDEKAISESKEAGRGDDDEIEKVQKSALRDEDIGGDGDGNEDDDEGGGTKGGQSLSTRLAPPPPPLVREHDGDDNEGGGEGGGALGNEPSPPTPPRTSRPRTRTTALAATAAAEVTVARGGDGGGEGGGDNSDNVVDIAAAAQGEYDVGEDDKQGVGVEDEHGEHGGGGTERKKTRRSGAATVSVTASPVKGGGGISAASGNVAIHPLPARISSHVRGNNIDDDNNDDDNNDDDNNDDDNASARKGKSIDSMNGDAEGGGGERRRQQARRGRSKGAAEQDESPPPPPRQTRAAAANNTTQMTSKYLHGVRQVPSGRWRGSFNLPTQAKDLLEAAGGPWPKLTEVFETQKEASEFRDRLCDEYQKYSKKPLKKNS